MWKWQTDKSESQAHGETNTRGTHPAPLLPGPRPPTAGPAAATAGRPLAPTLRRAPLGEATRADPQNLSSPNNPMRSADKSRSVLQVFHLN